MATAALRHAVRFDAEGVAAGAEMREDRRELGGQRVVEHEALAGGRLVEREPRRVQERAGRARIASREPP